MSCLREHHVFPNSLMMGPGISKIGGAHVVGTAEASATLTVTVAAVSPPTLLFIGSASAAGSTGEVSMNLPVGIQAGDLVIVAAGCTSTSNRDPGATTSGYTEIGDWYTDTAGKDGNLSISYKFMGSVPDTTVSATGASQHSSYGARMAYHVWRGVNQSNPFDVSAVVQNTSIAASTASGPTNPTITPVTPGAVAIAIAGVAANSYSAVAGFTCPDGIENCEAGGTFNSASYMLGICSKPWDGASEVSFGAWKNRPTDSQVIGVNLVTLALRPA